MVINDVEIRKFRAMIFRWWKHNKRNLPWRHTNDPYKIIVSEIMLQQTQVFRVIPKYVEFIEAWPDVVSLAHASQADILRLWKGMGYNRRALYLHKMANIIVKNFDSQFPESERQLSKLPGVGTYTTRALLVFAFKQNVACVDTNIRKIITHYFFNDTVQTSSVIQTSADALVPKGKSWEWHQALMDFGAAHASELRIPSALLRTGSNYELRIKKKPFKETNRFIRGRIIDLLRERAYMKTKLIEELFLRYGREKKYYSGCIDGLMKDGLLILVGQEVRLP